MKHYFQSVCLLLNFYNLDSSFSAKLQVESFKSIPKIQDLFIEYLFEKFRSLKLDNLFQVWFFFNSYFTVVDQYFECIIFKSFLLFSFQPIQVFHGSNWDTFYYKKYILVQLEHNEVIWWKAVYRYIILNLRTLDLNLIFTFCEQYPSALEIYLSVLNERTILQLEPFNSKFSFDGSFYTCKKRIDHFVSVQKLTQKCMSQIFNDECNKDAQAMFDKVEWAFNF